MDLPIILSITAIVVSVSMSIITLLLTEFRGPNISLLTEPDFKVEDEHPRLNFDEQIRQGYIPKWLELQPIFFVFANHGGKSGTILDLKLDFVPHSSFRNFFERFYFDFGVDSGPPVTTKEGDNQYLQASLTLYTIDWKETSLAEVLDLSLEVDDIIAKALEKSKEKFERYCDFLDRSQELGKVSCIITLTKGRFRTKLKTEELFKSITVTNHYDKAVTSLRTCLHKWEKLEPTKSQMLDVIKKDLERLIKELNADLKVSETKVDESNIDRSRLKLDAWKTLNNIRASDERIIRWFLIKSEGLEKDLVQLYEEITAYNDTVDEALRLGELRTGKDFQMINDERRELYPQIEKVTSQLSSLYAKHIH